MKTVMLDLWRPVGRGHSYMEHEEMLALDEWQGPPNGRDYSDLTESYLRDMSGADRLVELLRRDESMLIYVNKWGIHPPYGKSVPPDFDYVPSFLGARLPDEARRRESLRDYHKAMRWSVDEFFARVLPAVEQSDAVVVYTSDHGQALYEKGYELSHCSLTPDLALGEVYVPLFLAASSASVREMYREAAGRRFNRASHFEVFPTLLGLMGYSREWVEPRYGANLLDFRPERPRGFLLGTFYSPGAYWVPVD
jgi:glucan phosphoethanolaminetransferase (alkaline phosphatase superfamily)